MSDNFKPINVPNIDFSKLAKPQLDLSFAQQQTQAIQSAMDAVQAERERKEANEEARNYPEPSRHRTKYGESLYAC